MNNHEPAHQGTHFRLYDKLGSHVMTEGKGCTYFAVWAPDTEQVSFFTSNP